MKERKEEEKGKGEERNGRREEILRQTEKHC